MQVHDVLKPGFSNHSVISTSHSMGKTRFLVFEEIDVPFYLLKTALLVKVF